MCFGYICPLSVCSKFLFIFKDKLSLCSLTWLELMSLLHQPPKGWDYRLIPPHLA
jgi:hypothetical protein